MVLLHRTGCFEGLPHWWAWDKKPCHQVFGNVGTFLTWTFGFSYTQWQKVLAYSSCAVHSTELREDIRLRWDQEKEKQGHPGKISAHEGFFLI